MRPIYYDITVAKGEGFGDRFPAIIYGPQRISWKTLRDRVNRLANGLTAFGLKKGSLCAFIFYNSPEFAETYLAIQALGAIPVPINYRYTPSELAYVVKNCEPECLIFSSEFLEIVNSARDEIKVKTYICKGTKVPEWAHDYEGVIRTSSNEDIMTDVSYDDTAVIIYTGGTTGMPKGVVLSYDNIRSNEEAIMAYLMNLLPSNENESSSLKRKVEKIVMDMFPAVERLLSIPSLENRCIRVVIKKEGGIQIPTFRVIKKNGEGRVLLGEGDKADLELIINVKENLLEVIKFEVFNSSLKGRLKLIPHLLSGKRIMEINGDTRLKLSLLMRMLFTIKMPEPNKALIVPPMFHVASLALFMNHLLYPFGTIIFPVSKSFDPTEVLNIIDVEKPTTTFMVPTMWKRIVSHPEIGKFNLDSIRIILSGAAVLDAETKKKIIKTFRNAILMDAMGQTEMAPVTTVKVDAEDTEVKHRSVGKPLPGVEVKIVDDTGNTLPPGEVGEICYRGPNVMKEYLKDPEKTRKVIDKDGWFHSGDLGYIGENGEIYIVERKSECINTGGEKVYPVEVEEVISTHPKVRQVVVVGIPDEIWGEKVGALIVLKEGEECTEEEIINWCDGKIAGYKKPKVVKFVSELPISPVGKVQRKKAKEIMENLLKGD